MNDKLFVFQGEIYPRFLEQGNGSSAIVPIAKHWCVGKGLDVGAGKWPFPGAIPIDLRNGKDAMDVPAGPWDYVFSSHCLEHLHDPAAALRKWYSVLRPGGCLFLYLPHPDMRRWLPENNKGHLHIWRPFDAADLVREAGFVNVLHSHRDFFWSFVVAGFKPEKHEQIPETD